MYAAVDATAVDMQPIRDEHEVWTVIFMLFMMLGNMLFLNLFVGVTIDNFNKTKHQSENSDSLFMTDVQQAWVKTQEVLLKIEPERQAEAPSNRARRACHHVVMDPRVEKGVMMCIFLNTAVMAMEHFGQSDTLALFVDTMNLVFAVVFTVEMAVKLLALGSRYAEENWNLFDGTIVVFTWVGIVVSALLGSNLGSIATIIRTFRIGRALRLVQGAASMRRLFNTLLVTLPGLGTIFLLLVLGLFIYAVIGVELFATVQLQRLAR